MLTFNDIENILREVPEFTLHIYEKWCDGGPMVQGSDASLEPNIDYGPPIIAMDAMLEYTIVSINTDYLTEYIKTSQEWRYLLKWPVIRRLRPVDRGCLCTTCVFQIVSRRKENQ